MGGPARYLAETFHCQVHSVELQGNLVTLSRELNRKTGLEKSVIVVEGDILETDWKEYFNGIVSFLTFLHISDKPRLWSRVHGCLKPGAAFCVEDYFCRRTPTSEEEDSIRNVVGVPVLQTKGEYLQSVEGAGLVPVQWQDLSETWAHWTKERYEQAGSGEKKAAGHLLEFYKVVADLFESGMLGGVRISGIRPES